MVELLAGYPELHGLRDTRLLPSSGLTTWNVDDELTLGTYYNQENHYLTSQVIG